MTRSSSSSSSSPDPSPSPPQKQRNKQNYEGEGASERMYNYIIAHTREPDILKKVREDTAVQFPQAAHMAVSPEQGAFLGWLLGALNVKRAIEVGVFTGYSSIAMGLALPPDGQLIACDRDPTAMAIAATHWESAGISHKLVPKIGPAIETLHSLLESGEEGNFDFAFVDADKRKYRDYYEILLRLLRTGGVIAIDNVLWYGKIADPEVGDKATVALRELNAFVVQDVDRVDVSLVPIGDGILLCRKK